MIPIFAQSDWTAPAGFAAWIACAAFALFLINQGFKAWKNFQGKPTAGEVQYEAHEKFTPIKMFQDHVQKNDREHTEFRAEQKKDRDDNEQHASTRSKTLFQKIDDTRKEVVGELGKKHEENTDRLNELEKTVAALDKATELQNQTLASMNSNLITILKEMPRRS